MKKYSLSAIIFLLSLNLGYGQQFRQVDKNLDVFYKLNPSSKINLFFNQPNYIPGDTAYFLTRFLNSVDFKLIKKKSVFHLLLVDKAGHKAFDQFLLVENGLAPNQMVIPPTLHPGIYRLLCFKEQSNAQELVYQQTFEIPGGSKDSVVDTVRSVSIFPEGGSILEENENKIFVSVRPANTVRLNVLDDSNKQVGSFKTNSKGVGYFFLNPKSSQTFSVSAVLKGKSIKVPLPIKKTNGVSFKSIVANGKLTVTGKVFGFHGQPEIVLVRNDRVYYAEKIKLDSSQSFFSEISLGETLKGLFQLWIVDVSKVLSSRTLYADPGIDNEILKVKHPFQSHPRNKIEIQVEKNDSLMRGNFSIRIYQKSIFSTKSKNIFSDLELSSDLFQKSLLSQGEVAYDSINDFLATQPWQRYNIDSLYKGKFKVKKPSFDQGYVIKGKCTHVQNLNLPKPTNVTLYFENSNFIEEAVLDKNGNFSVELTKPIPLNEKVYYKVEANETELIDAKLEIANVSNILPAIPTNISPAPNSYFSYKTATDSIQQSYQYFSSESKLPIPVGKAKSLEARLYGADREYNMADYLAFSTMKEVIVEIMGKVAIKKVNGKSSVRIYLEDLNNPNPVLAKGEPLYIIDGIPTHNSEFFLNLKPSKVNKIKIIWKGERSVLKAFGRNGIIIVETKDATSTVNIPALNYFSLTGFSTPLPFWSPRNLTDTRFPYFRSCLYWDPLLPFDKDGVSRISFFTSDDLGEYMVDIEGLTADGAPYSHQSSFTIVPGK